MTYVRQRYQRDAGLRKVLSICEPSFAGGPPRVLVVWDDESGGFKRVHRWSHDIIPSYICVDPGGSHLGLELGEVYLLHRDLDPGRIQVHKPGSEVLLCGMRSRFRLLRPWL